jgi:hypothetical protein
MVSERRFSGCPATNATCRLFGAAARRGAGRRNRWRHILGVGNAPYCAGPREGTRGGVARGHRMAVPACGRCVRGGQCGRRERRTPWWVPTIAWTHRLKGGRRWQRHEGSSMRTSRRVRSGWSGRRKCSQSTMSAPCRPERRPDALASQPPRISRCSALSRSFLPRQGGLRSGGIWQLSESADRQDQPNQSVHALRGIRGGWGTGTGRGASAAAAAEHRVLASRL